MTIHTDPRYQLGWWTREKVQKTFQDEYLRNIYLMMTVREMREGKSHEEIINFILNNN